jgi:hypothetical protein
MKIRIELGRGLLRMKESFYLIENFFRSKQDIRRVRIKDIEKDETDKAETQKQEEETDIWETVVEKKDQLNANQRTSQKRTFM